jgi:hypothetical protein
MLRVGMQFWTLCVLLVFVTLCVTQRFCYVSWICLRLKAPFRPSATHFEGTKVSKVPAPFQGSAVTYVALCVVSDIAMKKRFRLCAVITGKA